MRLKYGNKKTQCKNHHKHDSKAEAAYCDQLHRDVRYTVIIQQPSLYLTEAKILYKPDFYVESGIGSFYIDVKGMNTPVFQIKKRLYKKYGPKEDLLIVKGKKTEIVKGTK